MLVCIYCGLILRHKCDLGVNLFIIEDVPDPVWHITPYLPDPSLLTLNGLGGSANLNVRLGSPRIVCTTLSRKHAYIF